MSSLPGDSLRLRSSTLIGNSLSCTLLFFLYQRFISEFLLTFVKQIFVDHYDLLFNFCTITIYAFTYGFIFYRLRDLFLVLNLTPLLLRFDFNQRNTYLSRFAVQLHRYWPLHDSVCSLWEKNIKKFHPTTHWGSPNCIEVFQLNAG